MQCLPLTMPTSVKKGVFVKECEYSQTKEEAEIVIKLIITGM